MLRICAEILGRRAKRDSPKWYGWNIRFVWLVASCIGPFSRSGKAKWTGWAKEQAYRFGRHHYGVHFNTPRFSPNVELANAYDSGAYDAWLLCLHDEGWECFFP